MSLPSATARKSECTPLPEGFVADAGPRLPALPMTLAAPSASDVQDILAVRPHRVIFNPGAENAEAADTLARHGISTIEACTLVLLATGQF